MKNPAPVGLEYKTGKARRDAALHATETNAKHKDLILLVDDDPVVCQVLQVLLEDEGYRVMHATNGADCLQMARNHRPDLILLDILMPGKDGRVVCRELRPISNAPIIMMSAISGDQEKVGRLNDGADDYITKPFSNAELLARVRAVLRRMHPAQRTRMYRDDSLAIDFDAHVLMVNGETIALSPREWRLLEYLHRHQGRTVPREALLRHAWGKGYERAYSYLKVFISTLRHKLQDPARHPRYIFTAYEMGYRFDPPKG
ncbi:MAG: response regulator transcription factor [Chloroflexi bacterium]|nr:response regulator transcription factor [Chloroflexota bacterium]